MGKWHGVVSVSSRALTTDPRESQHGRGFHSPSSGESCRRLCTCGCTAGRVLVELGLGVEDAACSRGETCAEAEGELVDGQDGCPAPQVVSSA